MGQRQGSPVLEPLGDDRLESWKEIAKYLQRGVRTIQRWEQTEGLPVHRHLHAKNATVFAYRSELAEWYSGRRDLQEQAPGANGSAEKPVTGSPVSLSISKGRVAALAGVLTVVAVSVAGVLHTRRPQSSPTPVFAAHPVIAHMGRAFGAQLSPDGKRVVYCWYGEAEDNLDIYVQTLGEGSPRRLTSHPEREANASWSPDGRTIAFSRDGRLILTVPADGGPERRIIDLKTAEGGNVLGLAWSPDGQWLVISHLPSYDGQAALTRLSLKTGSLRKLTAPPLNAVGDIQPAFSPDGRSLLFLRQYRASSSDVYLIGLNHSLAARSEPVRLTFDNRQVRGADWLPGGESIVFSSDRLGEPSLWTLQSAGFGDPKAVPRRLPLIGSEGQQPSVSRHGHQLVYWRHSLNSNIWRQSLRRGRAAHAVPERLIASSREEWDPQYSPDGRRIAFMSTRSGAVELWLCDADGSQPVQLTSFRGPRIHHPRWSPDSRRIVFYAGPEGQSEIYQVNAAGGQVQQVTGHPGNDRTPSWSRDGRWIFFTSNRTGENQVWKVRADGAEGPIQVTKDGGHNPVESEDGKWLYYRNDGLWRMPTAGGMPSRIIQSDIGYYLVVEDGVYYQSRTRPSPLWFFRFTTGIQEEVKGTENQGSPGLSVSPDRQYILFSQFDHQGSELMLVNDVRKVAGELR